jgi:nucleoside-diphosphate-sugar epimerase
VARALIVGCGCRGRALGERLLSEGWAVRGTSRREEGLATIGAAGIEPALADPLQPSTVLDLVGDVATVLWLFGSASGAPQDVAAIHDARLERVLERLVETPVRKFVYEASGSVDRAVLEQGASTVRAAGERWRIPVAVVESDPRDPATWVEAMLSAASKPASPAGESIWLDSDGN